MWSLFEENEKDRLRYERKAAAEERFIQGIRDRQGGCETEAAAHEALVTDVRAEWLEGDDHEQQKPGDEASEEPWRVALDAKLKRKRTQTDRELFMLHWDGIASMAKALEQEMLATSSELAQELLMQSFWTWAKQERELLASRSAVFWA